MSHPFSDETQTAVSDPSSVAPDAGVRRSVIIAGAGPVGMTLALELSLYGVKSTLVERNAVTTTFPKMDLTNARSMELLDRLGIAEEIRAAGVAAHHSHDVVFATSMAGRQIGHWKYPSVDGMTAWIESVNDGTTPSQAWQRVTQIEVERLLMRRCQADDNIEVLRPWRVDAVTQDDSGAHVQITSASTSEVLALEADYVVGCDGAGSVVRRAMGLTMEGERGVISFCQVHFKSRDLETLHAHGQFWHTFFVGGGVGAIIAQDERDTWTLQTSAITDGVRTEDIDKQELLNAACGRRLEIDEVLQSSVWHANVLVADRYRDGRLFVAGDAAHEVIPTGGYGLNTGFGDVFNLGWKLAAVVNGAGGDVLLDSYELERRPVAVTARDWSFKHLNVHVKAQQLIDLDLIDAEGPEGDQHRRELFDYFASNTGEHESYGVEMGYRYDGSPVVVADDSPLSVVDGEAYAPSTLAGARAPHVRLADGRSIHKHFRDRFTLVSFVGTDAADALVREAAAAGLPLQVVAIDDANARAVYERDLVLVRPDGHVAWRGDALLDNVAGLVRIISGRVEATVETAAAAV
ncbi:FAD-dependent monooxygenase [Gordonia rubripertincta]|uniref:FAD-dependent monooxygenase n=2 Tax=Gordonia rubripertincta TaxID=36822 RepID=A0AAW6RCT3_GORRU|nr:FAD-dependent monooxygenase [Gordonia rubripertincta]MDG6783789.1 FAD-dependent monooxygenase [Gordonia rubripertincta]NKY65975.1 polyketide hydroxylase [Gordonia rubripertincta]GAB86950.1 polyketide hydroxylase [Gordonia rubripertincta NBRC 101908]